MLRKSTKIFYMRINAINLILQIPQNWTKKMGKQHRVRHGEGERESEKKGNNEIVGQTEGNFDCETHLWFIWAHI